MTFFYIAAFLFWTVMVASVAYHLGTAHGFIDGIDERRRAKGGKTK